MEFSPSYKPKACDLPHAAVLQLFFCDVSRGGGGVACYTSLTQQVDEVPGEDGLAGDHRMPVAAPDDALRYLFGECDHVFGGCCGVHLQVLVGPVVHTVKLAELECVGMLVRAPHVARVVGDVEKSVARHCLPRLQLACAGLISGKTSAIQARTHRLQNWFVGPCNYVSASLVVRGSVRFWCMTS